MEILTEFDALQDAMSKINLNESVMPYVNGRLVDNGAFNKIQKILDCPEMVSCHKYLYNLDLDQLNEDEIDKVDKLYKLGCDRGFIVDDLTDWDADYSIDTEVDGIVANKVEDKPIEDKTAEDKPIAGTLFKAKIPCWTIIYSATSKDGQIKTGEAYSNAISASAAKADVKAKLSNIGYSDITILAIESCEADVEATSFKTEDVPVENTVVDQTELSEADKDTKEEDGEDDKSEAEDKVEEDSEEETEEKSSEEDASDEEDVDDKSDKSSEEEASDEEETSDEESTDEDSAKDSEEDSEEETEEKSSEEETSDESSEKEEDAEDEELDANEKAELKDKYKKTFKNTLVKCKFTKSFNDLTLEEKVKFFTQLSKAWTKNEPNEFMTDKEMEQLNNIVVNPDSDED